MYQGEVTSLDARCFDIYYLEARCFDAEANGIDPLWPLRVMRPGVVSNRRFVAGHDDSHANTLPHVNGAFRVEGDWPQPITITRGWAKATARPWNDEASDGFIRLERGRADFLRSVTDEVAANSGGGVFSPAIFGSSTRIWIRAGYEEVMRLDVMERPLGIEIEQPTRRVEVVGRPPWQRLFEIDQLAFSGFWRMSIHGLKEAFHSTSSGVLMTIGENGHIGGFAIVGSQWGTAYLQRIAVEPSAGGKGLGTDLLRAAVKWARSTPAATIVLNVRSGNSRARSLYERAAFRQTGTSLRILRHGRTTLLDQ